MQRFQSAQDVNPLGDLEKHQRRSWLKIHSQYEAEQACKVWVKTISLDELCDVDHINEWLHVKMVEQILGNPSKNIKRVRRVFNVRVLEDLKVENGFSEYGGREFEEWEAGDYKNLDAESAIKLYLLYGPYSKSTSKKGKVVEFTPEPPEPTKKKKAD